MDFLIWHITGPGKMTIFLHCRIYFGMETILYFYRKRGLDKPLVEPVGLKQYMLIRVGLDVQEEEWFGLKLGAEEVLTEKTADGAAKAATKTAAKAETKAAKKAAAKAETKTVKKVAAKAETKTVKKAATKAVAEAEMKAAAEVTAEELEKADGKERRLWKLLSPLQQLRQYCLKRQAERLEEERRHMAAQAGRRIQEEQEARIRQTEEALRKLAEEIMELAGDREGCRLVYEQKIRDAVVGRGKTDTIERTAVTAAPCVLSVLWKKYFDLKEFDGYRQRFWMKQVLSEAVFHHYVILGSCSEIFELLEECAHNMKSLRWLLLEAECNEDLLDFTEDFYLEYGLAIELQTFQSAAAFRQLRLVCGQPSNIIDFAGDVCFRTAEVAEGSIWLDMLSREEKRYRISGRQGEIRYVSLKEKWKHIQRRCKAPKVQDVRAAAVNGFR